MSEPTNIQDRIDEEVANAREVCNADNSSESAAAWDAVEELQAEASHQKEAVPQKNSLEKYCDENPEAAECRIYDD
ncbi:MAG: Calvin cycle protein CP12 [Cyanophyceae cyanobacterium]